MKHNILRIKFINLSIFMILFGFSTTVYPQYAIKWLSAGSLHNWYSEIGSEIEEGFVKEQQYGLQWPAISSRQDIQAAKGLWIGTTNFSDPNDPQSPYPYKVVHVGPRVTGAGEFFPQGFTMTSQFEPPLVFVDNDLSLDKSVDNNDVDPTLFADRVIENKVNTQIGISMTRKIFQFSQQYHDNYIVSEYTFKNTGNTDGDADIELPSTTLTGVYFYYQFRLAVCANVRNVIGNSTSWGINTMNDTRGDGVKVDTDNPDNLRFHYMWHGKLPSFTRYDNIGGPIWSSALWVEPGDTVGRLGASQFAGVVTLHADVSATDKNDDPLQPSTTSWEGSDEPQTSNNDSFNKEKMRVEYTSWMMRGHKSPRHANVVEPNDYQGFTNPTGDPALGTPGGFSFTNGYGPYTLAPGDSITLVFAEGVAGISRALATETGIKYKTGQITAEQKNQVVFQSRDSLFQTFRRANANFQSGYNIPRPPLPPKVFNVNGGGDRIALSWETYDDPGANLEGFEIYRATGKFDSSYTLIHTAGPSERSYDDVTPVRGLSYYYYIVSVGSESSNTGVGLTPPGKLRSSRYYTQTYNPAVLKRQPGGSPYSAVVKGNKDAPFYIRAGINDKLRINVDNNGPVDIVIPADSTEIDTLEINDVVAAINLALQVNVAEDNGYGYLWLTSPSSGTDSKIEILDIPQNAYAELGLSIGLSEGGVPTEQEALDQIRVVPNPYNISASSELGFGELAQNRLYFFNIPGRCDIKIYSELGELVETIEHRDGSGDQAWDSLTSSGQIIVSGIYIAVIENKDTGGKKIVKFVIIR